jgi:hypothetical protein
MMPIADNAGVAVAPATAAATSRLVPSTSADLKASVQALESMKLRAEEQEDQENQSAAAANAQLNLVSAKQPHSQRAHSQRAAPALILSFSDVRNPRSS